MSDKKKDQKTQDASSKDDGSPDLRKAQAQAADRKRTFGSPGVEKKG